MKLRFGFRWEWRVEAGRPFERWTRYQLGPFFVLACWPARQPGQSCATCRHFTGCDLDDPDDEIGKCWLDYFDGNQVNGYYPWRGRDYWCDRYAGQTDGAQVVER